MTGPVPPTATPRFSIETLTAATSQGKIVSLGFPKEKALTGALHSLFALVPEGTDEEKASKAKAKHEMLEALRDNEPCLSLGLDPATGHPNTQDWAILAAHPDRLGRRVILGGAYKRLRTGARGQYWQTVVRAPSQIINGIAKALGFAPTPAPKPIYGTPGGGYGGYQPQAPQGFQPVGGQGNESSVTEEDPNVGQGDDFNF